MDESPRVGIGYATSEGGPLHKVLDPDTEAAARLCDLLSMHADMRMAQSRFAALHQLLTDAAAAGVEADSVVAEALLDAGVIAYARPFASGVRKQLLRPSDLASRLEDPSEGMAAHEHILLIRNKYIAHSDNHDDQAVVGFIALPASDTGDLTYLGLHWESRRTQRADLEWATFGHNVASAWVQIIEEKIVAQRDLVAADGAAMTPEELLALRPANAPVVADVSAARRRPKPGRMPATRSPE